MAQPSGDHIPLGGFVSLNSPVIMSTTPGSTFSEEDDLFERRSKGRTAINRDALMFFAGHADVHSCTVRDVTNDGAGIRLSGLNILPSEFGISFDRFRTMRLCRLVWRDGDFVGATFES
jgi:hypothetical protein